MAAAANAATSVSEYSACTETILCLLRQPVRRCNMNETETRRLMDLREGIMRYRRLKEETSDPVAERFLRDILVDLEAEVALLKSSNRD